MTDRPSGVPAEPGAGDPHIPFIDRNDPLKVGVLSCRCGNWQPEHGWSQHLAASQPAPEPSALREALRMLAYVWNEADLEHGFKVSDYFADDDPLTLDIERVLAATPQDKP